MDLEQALEQFDAVEANLRRIEKVWAEMRKLIPEGIAFGEDERYTELFQAYEAIRTELPAIGNFTIKDEPYVLDSVAQARLEAQESQDLTKITLAEAAINKPSRDIADYRSRLNQARRELVRDHLIRLVNEIDSLLSSMLPRIASDRGSIEDEAWEQFVDAFTQAERLAGGMVPRTGRWQELRRHIAWGQGQDLHDIVNFDWPSVKTDIQTNLYSELEPIPVAVENLASLVESKPSGPVSTKLNWSAISAEDFERLLFNIVADATGYTNPQWLTHTNAPDRGRDISVEKIIQDPLGGTRIERVIIQAKHWTTRSVRLQDVSEAVTQVELWEPPRVHVLVNSHRRALLDLAPMFEFDISTGSRSVGTPTRGWGIPRSNGSGTQTQDRRW